MPEVQQVYQPDDWVKERTSVGEGKVIKVRNNRAGKQIVTYEMTTGQTVTQFADFLDRGTPPVETAPILPT
jgi:hypothetical protein